MQAQPNLAEAERRIEEARRTQAASLDLGDLALRALPVSVATLPHLRVLFLGAAYPDPDDAQELVWDAERETSELADLTPLQGLQGLQNLDLSRCTGVTDLTPLHGLQGLQNLYLGSCTGVTDLTPLQGLQGLQNLNLWGGRPVERPLLRELAHHSNLASLILDEAAEVPREVLSHEYDDNCLPRLRSWLAELNLGGEAENEVKVILLGNGRVGKTQLCRRFRGETFDPAVESTHGVQIWREELRLRTGAEDQVFQVNWWDFGGQDIYHGTHALFLRSRAVFLILWAPELEDRAEYEENGITLRNQPLSYWLDYVRTLAGDDSPVIVVQSQCDRPSDRRADPPRPGGAGFFECCAYSAKEDRGRETLEAHLREAVRSLLDRSGSLQIGHGRAEVRRRLYAWRSDDQARPPAERRHRTLTPEQFQILCEEVGGIASWQHALDYFHHTGAVFYQPDLFSAAIVLDQTWALDAVYTVFHRGRTMPWLRNSGRFTCEDLAATIWQEHSEEEQCLFLSLMVSCGVCFPCGTTAQGETLYVAPDLLPPREGVTLPAWNPAAATPTLRLEYRFFHPAVIRRLMSEIGHEAENLAEYWKYGLWLKDGRRGAQLLIHFEDTSTADAPGAGALGLQAYGGHGPLGLLRKIRYSILRHPIGGELPEELLTLHGTTVAGSALAATIHGRVLDARNRPVPAADFAAFFDRELPDHAPLDILAQRPGADEKVPEVFLSYAWGDDSPAGKIRDQVIDGLYEALTQEGLSPIRDRNAMRPGDRISAFIDRLTRADHVVAVISDKYLRSPYCMYEIYRLWQKSQEDADLMAERVVPIVLPEVKIGRLPERVPYIKYWRQQHEELEAAFNEVGTALAPESLRELRLVRDFAHHVDGILVFLQDVLMPRKLEAHLDDGFEAVRGALRRRMGRG